MGGALCLKFTDPTVLDAQGVTGGALFLRFRASLFLRIRWVVLCVTDPIILDGGALFLRFRASWVVLCASSSRTPPFSMHRASWVVRCSSGSGRRGWCSVPQVHGLHRSRCAGRHLGGVCSSGCHGWCGVPQVQGVVGGVLCLRFMDPPFSMHGVSWVVRCSSGSGRHRGPGRTSGGLIKFPGWPGQHFDHGWTMLRRWWGVILPAACRTLRTIYRTFTLSHPIPRPLPR